MLFEYIRPRVLCSVLVFISVCEFCSAQGYYGYNPYYPYYRRPTSTQAAKRVPSAVNRLQNNYLSNPYASVSSSNKRTQSAVTNSLPDIYRRRPYSYATSANTPKTTTTTTRRPTTKYRVSKADAENAKFVGASNQESVDESSKTLQLLHRRRRPYGNRCSIFGRQSGGLNTAATTAPKEQGRFLWDLNVYNIYGAGSPVGGGIYSDPIQSANPYGCGGGGGGLGGGLLSDSYDNGYAPPAPPLNTFLSLFAPGILQNALAVTARPQFALQSLQPQNDPTGSDLQSDPAVDPNYGQSTLPVRRPPAVVPNRIYYDSPGASPVTPAQLIGGVATTVNGIIQQLTGNVQPVYPGYG